MKLPSLRTMLEIDELRSTLAVLQEENAKKRLQLAALREENAEVRSQLGQSAC